MNVEDGREVYPNAPLVLVAMEVRHPAADPLTPAQRNLVKQRLSRHVSLMRLTRHQQLTVVGAVGTAPPASDLRTEEFPRYFSRDNTVSVSMRTDAFVIETSRYPGWEQLRALIADASETRQEIGGVDGVERVGLRYVNEIRVPGVTEKGWESWVDPTVLGPGAIGIEFGLTSAQWQGQSVFTPAPGRQVVLRYGTREGFAVNPGGDLKRSTPTPGPFFLIDIDSFWSPTEAVPEFDAGMLSTVCDELHAPVRRLFERLITDRLREEVLRRAE